MIMEPTGRDGAEPPVAVAHAMKSSNVVIAPTFHSLSYTKARIEASKAGVRVVTMPNVTEFSFTKGGLTADYDEIKRLTEKILSVVKNSHKVEVKSENGTNVTLSIEGKHWRKDTGIIHTSKDTGNLPAGEIFIAPVENSVNGTIVFDSFKLSDGELKLEIKDGKVVDVIGKAKELLKIFENLGERAKVVCEFGIGTNPKARIIGNTLEDEKVLGSVHFALGSNMSFGGKNSVKFHKDGIIARPTVVIDNKLIIENGKWKI
jgi:leucyl aminopeptidase (aminopeptidase T)